MISLNYGGIYDYNVFITDIKVKKNKEVIPDIEKFLNRVLFKRKLYNALTDSEYNYVAFTGFCKQKKCFLRIFLFKRFLDLETPKYNSEIGGIHGDEYTYYIEIQGESLIYKDLFYFIKSNQDGTKLLPYNKEKQAIEIKSDNTFDFIIESKLVKSIIITNNNNDILSQILLLKLF